MEVEESFDALFRDLDFENSDWVLPLAKKCIATAPGEKEVVRALEIFLCIYVKKFDVEDLEEEIFQIACPAARNFFVEKFKYLEKNPTNCVETLNILLKIISYCDRAFVHLNEFPKIPLIEVKSLLICTSEILLSSFSHCKMSEQVYGTLFSSLTECLSNFFKTCCSLQDRLLCILTEKVECDTEDDREVLVLDEVMTFLSKLGVILINLEVKTMAKVWKSFAFLIEKYLSCLKQNFNIGETVKNLSDSIINNMESVLSKENQDFSRIIKLNCFLLKLVIKFSEVFMECLKNCQNSVLNLLLLLCRFDASLTSDTKCKVNVNDDLINQLTIGTNPLLSQIITDVNFIKECGAVGEEMKKSLDFCILCCLVLKKLTESNTTTRSLWFNKHHNILEWIFISASSSQFITCSSIRLPNILINGTQKKFSDLYEYVLVTISAFLMTGSSDEYCLTENILLQNVLQANPIRAVLAIDIWCLLARFADSELCFSQIQTLSKVFQEFHPQTLRVEKCYLGSLIRRLFPLLAPSHKSAFLKSFKSSFYSSVWDGVSTSGLSEKEALDIRRSVFAVVEPLLDQTSDFEMGMFSGFQDVNENLGDKIPKLWKFNSEVLASNCQSVPFLKTICSLTAYTIAEFSSENILLVLTQIKKLLSIGQSTPTKLFFIWILNSLSTVRIPANNFQRKIISSIAEIFRDLLLSKEVFIKQKVLESFYSFSHVTSHGEIISMTVQNAPELKTEITNYFKKKFPDQPGFCLDEYMRELYLLKFQHVCPTGAVISKKMKLDSNNMQDTIYRWKGDGKIIVERFQSLSDSERREIRNICNSILSLPM